MAYTISAQRVPRESRNKRIYTAEGSISKSFGAVGGSSGGGSGYTAGNGITITSTVIAMSTSYTGNFTFTGAVTSETGLNVTGGSLDVTSSNVVPLVMDTSAAQSLIQIQQSSVDKGFFGYIDEGSTGIGVWNGALTTVNFLITDAGDVGIGQTTPSFKLDITGDVGISDSSSTPLTISTSNVQNFIKFKANSIDVGWFGYTTTGNNGLSFLNAAGSTVNMIITDAGDIGIGNTAPAYKLHVTGNARITSTLSVGGHITAYTSGSYDIGASGGNYFRHGYFSGSVYSDDSIILNWNSTSQTLDADDTGLFTGSVFRFGDDMYSYDTTFASGFTGAGWKLDKTGSGATATYSFEVDNLRVRGTMHIYELVLNKIRATNGSLWVSDASELSSVTLVASDSYRCYVDDGANHPQTFVVNDIVKCQRFTGTNVKEWQGVVTSIHAGGEYFVVDLHASAPDIPEAYDTVVRIGNTTDTDRQGILYLTSSDSNSPYMEVLDGYDTAYDAFGGYRQLRIGKLDGITDSEFGALSGYGLWADGNIYLTGTINATAGLIAGWDITGDYIRKDYMPGQYDWLYMSHNGSGELPSGFGLVMASSAGVGEVRSVHMGELHVKDSHNTVDTGNFGFEIIKRTATSTYKHVVRIGQDEAFIAGWNINTARIFSGTEQTGDGYTTSGITLDSNGSIHAPNFYINSDETASIAGWGFNDSAIYSEATAHSGDGYSSAGITINSDGSLHAENFHINANGDVGFRGLEIIYAYIGVHATNIIHSHDTDASSISATYVAGKTITLGTYIQSSVTLRIKFDLNTSDVGETAYARLYRGGTPVGTERSTTSTSWVTYSQDISGWGANDTIVLMIKTTGGPFETVHVRNLRLYGEMATQVDEVTGTNS